MTGGETLGRVSQVEGSHPRVCTQMGDNQEGLELNMQPHNYGCAAVTIGGPNTSREEIKGMGMGSSQRSLTGG